MQGPPTRLFAKGVFNILFLHTAYQAYKRRQKSKLQRQHPGCPEVSYEKPRETSGFLEEGDEAAVTLGPPGPEQQHRLLSNQPHSVTGTGASLALHLPSWPVKTMHGCVNVTGGTV